MALKQHWAPAYIGAGSNLDGPENQVSRAADWLTGLPESRLISVSPLYVSPPMGSAKQPDYVNAVMALLTMLEPVALLGHLQSLEARAGRVRNGERWAPRSLDLDLLAYASRRVDTDDLRVPHPGLAKRPFVTLPLADLAPDLSIPGEGLVRELAQRHRHADIRRLP